MIAWFGRPSRPSGFPGTAARVGALRRWAALAAGLAVCGLVYAKGPLPTQTDVDRAEHVVDAQGVPALKIAGVGTYHNPAWVALYALAYAGVEVYDPALKLGSDRNRFRASVAWLADHLEANRQGDPVWLYRFDNSYNDVTIQTPWSSAFAQATGIQALLASYRLDGKAEHLQLAERAAQALFRPVEEGGLLFQRGDDVWFEEIPEPIANPPHILNGHMRALLALRELAEATGNPTYQAWFERGAATLERWLPRYDAGYWLRYDLNPKKSDLLFRIANPYGLKTHALAIDRITLRDPQSGSAIAIDLGAQGDAEGAARIAGIDWGQPSDLDGRRVRRLAEVEPRIDPGEPADAMHPPHTYFYFDLPGEWRDNLRGDWFELEIEYLDDAPANLSVQMRSIAPGIAFRDLRDGDLMLSGTGHWRKWIVPLRVTDLGFWVGQSYASKHAKYLNELAKAAPGLARWATVAQGYERLGQPLSKGTRIVDPPVAEPPAQTPIVPIYSLDKNGVLMPHRATPDSRFPNGFFDPTSDRGTPIYSPFVIARQALLGPKYFEGENTPFFHIDPADISPLPAITWLLDPANSRRIGDARVYEYNFPNVYNDVVTEPPWASAFGQAYVLKALVNSRQDPGVNISDAILRATALAYGQPVGAGGVTTWDRAGRAFFEEVPNATHVLNAHLISAQELSATAQALRDADIQGIGRAGLDTLRETLNLFDTGYWMKYDQNPKKDILLQLDWVAGEASPEIDEILLENPQTGTATRIDVGAPGDFDGHARLSGSDWLDLGPAGGRTVRSFRNGYAVNAEPVTGGTRHNVYVVGVLPEPHFTDFFDMPPHRLVIRYKDASRGKYILGVQAINEGNRLEFVPLRNGVWSTAGDGKWKEAVFYLRPQDLGWFKGPDYQGYETEQLGRIGELTKEWFFTQYAERQRYFLELQRLGRHPTVPGGVVDGRVSGGVASGWRGVPAPVNDTRPDLAPAVGSTESPAAREQEPGAEIDATSDRKQAVSLARQR